MRLISPIKYACCHVLEAAGVRDAIGKSLGSKNRLNVVKATVDALNNLRSAEEIAAARA
jgi:small subunit ribosomal protein S5